MKMFLYGFKLTKKDSSSCLEGYVYADKPWYLSWREALALSLETRFSQEKYKDYQPVIITFFSKL